MICHGNGALANDGCCYVNGAVCPNRLKVEGGKVYDSLGVDLGTKAVFTATEWPTNPTVADDQMTGTTFVCKVAVDVLVDKPSRLNSRNAFETAWEGHADYQPIADAWEAIGMPRNYCQVYGTAQAQCCFAEDQATNDASAAGLTTSAVSIRTGGGS